MASAALIFGRPPPIHPSSPSPARLSRSIHPDCFSPRGSACGTLALSLAAVIGGLKQRAAVIGELNQGSSRYVHEWNVPSLHRGTTTEKRTKETGEKRPRKQEKISPQKVSIIRVLK